MNVVFVIHDLKGNGAERVVLNLARLFVAQKAKVSIVVLKNQIDFQVPQGVSLFSYQKGFLRSIPRALRGRIVSPFLDRFIRKKCGVPSLVISNLAPADRLMAYSRLPNVRILIHSVVSEEMVGVHGGRSHKELQERLNLYRRKPLLAISEGVKEDLCGLLPGKNDIHHIYNPVDVESVKEAAQAPLPKNCPEKYIVHVGKFNSWKRQSFLLSAYAAADIELPLVFVGVGTHLHAVRKQACELAIDHKVYFVGFQSNPYPIIANASLLVLSSTFEGLSMVLLEALALGTPAVSTNCPCGPKEILPKSHLTPVQDLDALTQLLKVVCKDPSKWVVDLPEKFRSEVIMKQYLDIARP